MNSRLSYIDALKGIAITAVLLLHTLSDGARKAIIAPIHIGQAVPIFIAVTFFLSFLTMDRLNGKLIEWYKPARVLKMVKRVVIPFLIVLVLQCALLLFLSDVKPRVIIAGGGYGPGSYYLWVYLQVWFVAPLFYKLLKWRPLHGSVAILLLCIVLNMVSSRFCPDLLWRLLAIRYLFLSVPVWLWFHWIEYKIETKMMITVIGFMSLIYILFFADCDWRPFIYHGSWNAQNYPAFFWTLLLILLLVKIMPHFPPKMESLFEWMGVNSWEIFLAQMFIIGFVRQLPIIGNPSLKAILYVFFVFSTSLGSVFIYKSIVSRTRKMN